MKVTTLTIRVGRTRNLGNFNSIKVEVEASAKLTAGDDMHSAAFVLNADLERALDDSFSAHMQGVRG